MFFYKYNSVLNINFYMLNKVKYNIKMFIDKFNSVLN